MRYIGLDLSTKTGFVALDEDGNVLVAKEIISPFDGAKRMQHLSYLIKQEVEPDDCVAIEGFSYGSKGRGVDFQYGIGWIIRMWLYDLEILYIEPAPSQIKQFTGAKGNAKKSSVMIEAFKRWGFQHESDNVVDAYVLAQMCRLYHLGGGVPKFQKDILEKVRKLGE